MWHTGPVAIMRYLKCCGALVLMMVATQTMLSTVSAQTGQDSVASGSPIDPCQLVSCPEDGGPTMCRLAQVCDQDDVTSPSSCNKTKPVCFKSEDLASAFPPQTVCSLGLPLLDLPSRSTVTCDNATHTCPAGYLCVSQGDKGQGGLCCFSGARADDLPLCPVMGSASQGTSGDDSKDTALTLPDTLCTRQCHSDLPCVGNATCCSTGCGSKCLSRTALSTAATTNTPAAPVTTSMTVPTTAGTDTPTSTTTTTTRSTDTMTNIATDTTTASPTYSEASNQPYFTTSTQAYAATDDQTYSATSTQSSSATSPQSSSPTSSQAYHALNTHLYSAHDSQPYFQMDTPSYFHPQPYPAIYNPPYSAAGIPYFYAANTQTSPPTSPPTAPPTAAPDISTTTATTTTTTPTGSTDAITADSTTEQSATTTTAGSATTTSATSFCPDVIHYVSCGQVSCTSDADCPAGQQCCYSVTCHAVRWPGSSCVSSTSTPTTKPWSYQPDLFVPATHFGRQSFQPFHALSVPHVDSSSSAGKDDNFLKHSVFKVAPPKFSNQQFLPFDKSPLLSALRKNTFHGNHLEKKPSKSFGHVDWPQGFGYF